jgi:hypothetical protein
MLDEVRPNEPTDEPDWSMTKGKHFLNKWISPNNKVYQIDEVIFVDEYGNNRPTNDPVSIDLMIQLYVSGETTEECISEQLNERGWELFGNSNWEFEVKETEVVCIL